MRKAKKPPSDTGKLEKVQKELAAAKRELMIEAAVERVRTKALAMHNPEEIINEEYEKKILHHGQRADAIVKGMLQHSRGSSGEKELTDINVLVDEYLRLDDHGLRAKDKSFNADYKLELDESLPKINVVPQDIGRVLLNLINNAFYTISDKNTLVLRHSKDGSEEQIAHASSASALTN